MSFLEREMQVSLELDVTTDIVELMGCKRALALKQNSI
jgi:hypothetical protein